MKTPNVKEIKKYLPHVKDELINIKIFRFFTPLFLKLLILMKITANAVSFSWLILGLIGVVFVFTGDYKYGLIGIILIQISQFIDQMDGPLARYYGKAHPIGQYLDKVGVTIHRALLLTGISFGAYSFYGDEIYLYSAILMPIFSLGGIFFKDLRDTIAYHNNIKKFKITKSDQSNKIKDYVVEFLRPTNPLNITLFAAIFGYLYILALPYLGFMFLYFMYQFIRSYKMIKKF